MIMKQRKTLKKENEEYLQQNNIRKEEERAIELKKTK